MFTQKSGAVFFLILIIGLWSYVEFEIGGKVEIIYNEHGGEIFTGVGEKGNKQGFRWKEI
jgi:hypothetical protein